MSRWFFGTLSRFQAQRHLLEPENGEGAFLIRVSEKDNVGYVLSGEKNLATQPSVFFCSSKTASLWVGSFPFPPFLEEANLAEVFPLKMTATIAGVSAVRSGDQVKHYKIFQTNNSGFHVETSRRFGSLPELVAFYQKSSLSNEGPLGDPCKRVSPAVAPRRNRKLKVQVSAARRPSSRTNPARQLASLFQLTSGSCPRRSLTWRRS